MVGHSIATKLVLAFMVFFILNLDHQVAEADDIKFGIEIEFILNGKSDVGHWDYKDDLLNINCGNVKFDVVGEAQTEDNSGAKIGFPNGMKVELVSKPLTLNKENVIDVVRRAAFLFRTWESSPIWDIHNVGGCSWTEGDDYDLLLNYRDSMKITKKMKFGKITNQRAYDDSIKLATQNGCYKSKTSIQTNVDFPIKAFSPTNFDNMRNDPLIKNKVYALSYDPSKDYSDIKDPVYNSDKFINYNEQQKSFANLKLILCYEARSNGNDMKDAHRNLPKFRTNKARLSKFPTVDNLCYAERKAFRLPNCSSGSMTGNPIPCFDHNGKIGFVMELRFGDPETSINFVLNSDIDSVIKNANSRIPCADTLVDGVQRIWNNYSD